MAHSLHWSSSSTILENTTSCCLAKVRIMHGHLDIFYNPWMEGKKEQGRKGEKKIRNDSARIVERTEDR